MNKNKMKVFWRDEIKSELQINKLNFVERRDEFESDPIRSNVFVQ